MPNSTESSLTMTASISSTSSSSSREAVCSAVDGQQYLTLRSLLYTRNMYEKFARRHSLNKPDGANPHQHRMAVLRQILEQNVGVSCTRLPGWQETKRVLEKHLLAKIGDMIDLHTKYNYKEGLRVALERCKAFRSPSNEVPTQAVLSYVSEAVKFVIPYQLIGGNQKGVMKLARDLVRGTPPLTVQHLLRYLPQRLDVGWLQHVPDKLLRHNLAAKLCLWVASEFVTGAVRAMLVGVRGASGRGGPIYFPKPEWQSQTRRALNNLVETGCLARMPKEDIPDDRMEPGVLRFLPKANGLRPIIVRRLRDLDLIGKMNNARLLLKNILPPPFRMNERWTAFRDVVREARAAGGGKEVYFVRTDVRSAFVHVRQDKVKEVLNKHMAKLPPQVKIELPVTPWMQRKVLGSAGSTTRSTGTSQSSDEAPSAKKPKLAPRIVSVGRDTSYKIICREIEHQVVRHGAQRYHMRVGLAQGSPLSNNLCNMTLEDLCTTHLAHFNSEDGRSVLWRVADDFLFLSLSKSAAMEFQRRISTGFPDYGWTMSASKSEDNISYTDLMLVVFNGFVLDLLKMEACADLSQYKPDSTIHSMTFRLNKNKDLTEIFIKQLECIGSLKLTPLNFNSRTLSRERLLEHINSCGRLQALRFRSLTLYLFGDEAKKPAMAQFLVKRVWCASGLVCKRILNLLRASADPAAEEELPSKAEVKLLLNLAILKRSSGFLSAEARRLLKSSLFELEEHIPPERVVQCHAVSNREGDPWDPTL